MREVRCPECNKQIAQDLVGVLVFTCPRCKITRMVDRTEPLPVSATRQKVALSTERIIMHI